MPKHSLSLAPLPPAKRHRTLSESNSRSLVKLTFETALYDELILCIFSHLSWIDLCAAQATNKNWSRLAADNELWRKQFLQVFGHRLRGARGFRSDGRQLKSLPSRAKAEEYKDWKWMFRISSNWRKGRCLVEESPLPTHYAHLVPQTHVLVLGNMMILAPSTERALPEVTLRTLSGHQHTFHVPSAHDNAPSRITALALDQSTLTSSQTRLACFIYSGEFSLFSISHTSPSASRRDLAYTPPRRTRISPVTQAVYHHPLLITLSESFSLSIYNVTSGAVALQHTLTSFTSFPPSCMVLSVPTSTTYKLVIAYAIQVYPAHWSVGVTELIIANHSRSSSSGSTLSSSSHYLLPTASAPVSILSTRTARAVDVPQVWVDERKLRYMREQWSRKVSRIGATQTDGKWVVLAPDDSVRPALTAAVVPSYPHAASSLYSPTSLQLYRLSLPQPSSVASSSPKLTFVRTLNGQLGPISALALADGRCVSFGLNGSIWVWDLEAGTGTEVAEPEPGLTYQDPRFLSTKYCVSFDDRRIITTVGDRVMVRRFDI